MDKTQIERLHEMGFDSKAGSFLLYDQVWINFFNWMIENVTEDNIYSDTEQKELMQLNHYNQFLEENQLCEKRNQLKQEYPGILTYTETDLIAAEKELESITKLEESYRKPLKELQHLSSKLDNELIQWEDKVKTRKEHEKRMIEMCLEEACIVQKQNESQLSNFEATQSYINDENILNPPTFLGQMGIRKFQESSQLFVKHVDTFMTKNFSSSPADPKKTEETLQKIEDLKRKLTSAISKSTDLKEERINLKAVINKLLTTKIQNMTQREMELKTQEMRELNFVQNSQYEALQTENQNLIEYSVQADCDLLLVDRNKMQMEKTNANCKNLKFIHDKVSNALNYSEIMWFLLKIDLDKLTNHMKNVQKYMTGEFGQKKTYNVLNQIAQTDIEKQRKEFENDMINILKEFTDINSNDNPNIFEICEEVFRACRKKTKHIVNARYLDNFFGEIPKLQKLEQEIRSFVQNGATKYIYKRSPDLVYKEMKMKDVNINLEAKMDRMKAVFETNYLKKWEKDEPWAAKQMLWVWFLTDQKNLMAALHEIKKLAKTTAAYTKFDPNLKDLRTN